MSTREMAKIALMTVAAMIAVSIANRSIPQVRRITQG